MKKNSGLLITLLLCYTGIQAQSKSLLWEITGNGLTQPSYIYGTMHVSDRIAFHLTDSFFIALHSADVIALESNPETWIENDFGNPDKSDNNTYSESSYGFRSDYYGGDIYTRIAELEIPDDRAYGNMFQDNSWLINGYLYRYEAERTEYEEETYLDLFIFQCGKKLSKEIAALEGEQEVLKLLEKAYDTSDDEDEEKKYIEKRKMMDAFDEEDVSIREQIDQAYREGDLDKLDSLELITTPTANFHKYFIEERNANMMRRMDSILRTGKVMFTGIGAAHLPGERGAIEILRDMGYTVRPVKGKITGKSMKEKNKIDAIYFSHPTSMQYASDSLFTVSSPGKLYDLGGNATYSYVLYPDMANSAYYNVIRMAHYGMLQHQTQDEILANIDNLLFENVPGDIVSKTAIKSNTGYPGLDIVSKTKRGNYLRIKLFVTPFETIIFKSSGLGEFVVKSKEMQTFFSSINFKPVTKNTWETYTPKWGLFSVSVPANHISYEVLENESVYNQQAIATVQAQENDNYYYANTYYYNNNSSFEEDSFELKRIADMFTEQFKKDKYAVTSDAYQLVNNKLSYEQVSKSNANYIHTKVVVNGPYFYLLASMSPSETRPDAYFKSFNTSTFKYSRPFELYSDTAMLFSVKTIAPAVDTLLTIDEIEYNSYNSYDYGYDDEDEEKDVSYLSENKHSNFSSEITPENIAVSYHKYHKFRYYDDKIEFWNSFDSNYVAYDNYTISRRKFEEKGAVQSLEFIVTDTGSTRAVYRKFILKDNVLFQLSTVIDSVDGPSAFVSTFYNTFTPSDSISGRSIFSTASDSYFEQLNSEDSVLRKQSIKSVRVNQFVDTDAPKLIEFINSSNFRKLKATEKETFIMALGGLKDKSVIPALKQIYINAGDTSNIQLAVLSALSAKQTDTALATFMELLYVETPLAKNGNSLSYIFSGYLDTLELAAKLYPQVLDFSGFPEYRFATYRLLSLVIKQDSLNTAKYAPFKKQLVAEANAEFKRNVSGSNEVDRYSYNNYRNKNYFTTLKSLIGSKNYFDEYHYGPDQTSSIFSSDYSSRNYSSNYSSNYSDLYINDMKYGWATNLLDYFTLALSEFYDDPLVKTYFDKIYKSKNDELIYKTALTAYSSKISVPDSVWTNLQKTRAYRYTVINKLTDFKAVSKIDTAYGNQRSIAEAILYQYELTDEEDSIEFVTRREVDCELGHGYIYFYKSKLDNDKTWHLDCVGLQPMADSTYNLEPDFVHYGDVILDEEQMEEQITDIIKAIELAGRSRVRVELPGTNYGYDYDYDY